jgi:hypothetical protein
MSWFPFIAGVWFHVDTRAINAYISNTSIREIFHRFSIEARMTLVVSRLWKGLWVVPRVDENCVIPLKRQVCHLKGMFEISAANEVAIGDVGNLKTESWTMEEVDREGLDRGSVRVRIHVGERIGM